VQVDLGRILQVINVTSEAFSLLACSSSPTDSAQCYLVRRFNSCGEQERTTAAAAIVRVAPDGQLMPSAPNAISCLKGEQTAGNRIRLTWFYYPLDQGTPPEQFNVYWDRGITQIDLENPVAVIPYRGRKFYHHDSDVLSNGQYVFIIKAVGLGIVESILPAVVACRVKNPFHEPPSIVAVQCL
jgi:hypothetical protein